MLRSKTILCIFVWGVLTGCNQISGVGDLSFVDSDTETTSESESSTASASEVDTSTDSNSEMLNLGDACGSNDQCGLGYCADNVCCDQPCDGVCMVCGPDGRCDNVPTMDEKCNEVLCPADETCVTYTAPTGDCRAFGECAESVDCVPTYTSAETRTQCGDNENYVCDGEGTCEFRPAVECGTAGTCDTGFCCVNLNGSGVCAQNEISCPPVTSSQSELITFECDEPIDCEEGYYCEFVVPIVGVYRSTVCVEGEPPLEPDEPMPTMRRTVCNTTDDCNEDLYNTCIVNTDDWSSFVPYVCYVL